MWHPGRDVKIRRRALLRICEAIRLGFSELGEKA
jgi:hypothetical protein